MSKFHSWILTGFLCLALATPVFGAGEQTIRIGIDRDNDATTGCEFDPGTGDIREGVDLVLEVVVNANVSPPIVFSTAYSICSGDSFGPPTALGAGWEIGLNNGINGADVVEAALPVYLLGRTQTILLDAGVNDLNGSDDTQASLTFSAPVPTLGTIGLIVLMTLLLGVALWMMRRNRNRALLVLLGLSLVAATGTSFILDGQVGDWDGIAPLITDPLGDPGSTQATDIVALFACLENDDRLVFRIDIVDLENDPPIAEDDMASVDEDGSISIDVLANDSDPDFDAIEVTQVGTPASGTAVLQGDGTILYTPTPNTKGTDSFTYTISDPVGLTDTATVTVEVIPTGDPPVAVDDSFTTDEDTTNNMIAVLANDFDPDTGDVISITAVGKPNNGGTAVINGNQIDYTPAANFFGTETFTYMISDLAGKSDSALVTVTVNGVNDDPDAVDDFFTVDEDTTNNSLDVLANDTDAPDVGETLIITNVSTPDNGGSAIISGGGTAIDYTPAADFFGTEIFTYTIADGNGGSDTATVEMTVTNVDDPVTAVDDSFSASKDVVTTSPDVLANDSAPDGGLAVQSVDPTSVLGATIVNNGNGTFNYDISGVPALQGLDDGETSADSFTYTAEDIDLDVAMATVNVTVEGANDAPTADDINDSVNQNESLVINLSGADVDVENLTFSIVTPPVNGTLGAITSTGPTTAQVTYTHSNLNVNPDSFTYVANDGTVNSAPATVGLTVIPNIPPTAMDDGSLLSPITVQRNSFADIDVAANDTDGDGMLDLDSVAPTAGTLGTTMATGGGIVRYTANPNVTGADSFTYTIDDNDGGTSNTASVFVYINDPPVASDDMVAVAEGSTTVISVLTNDTDSDGTLDPATVAITTAVPGGQGMTMVNPDGTVFYDPSGYVGLTSFQYTVTDDLGGVSAPATVSINVSPAPVAMDDTFNVFGHTTVTVPASLGLLLNDTDDGNIFAETGTFATDNGGSITINVDGSFTYTTPGPGAATPPSLGGTDTFTYTIEDKLGSSDTATITFTYEKVVWFTNNTNASGSEDGSQADPFNALLDASASAQAGHTLFVFLGDGMATNQDAGITLLNNQELIGELAGLAVDVDGMGPGMPITIIPPGMRPVITNLAGDVVTLADSNLITGVQLEPQASAGIIGAEKDIREDGKKRHWRDLIADKREPTQWKRAGGDTSIIDVVINVLNDFSDGLVFLGQSGTVTINDLTINGPAMGNTGQVGLLFENCLVNANITGLTINDMLDSFVMFFNPGSTFNLENIDVDTRDGLGILGINSGTISMTGTGNEIDNTFGVGLVLEQITIGPSGFTLDHLSTSQCEQGITIMNTTGGPFAVTNAVDIVDMFDNGIEIVDSQIQIDFNGAVNVSMTGDDGIDITDHLGAMTFAGPTTLINISDDGIDIQGSEATIRFENTITMDMLGDTGIEINGENGGMPTGSIEFLDTVDIDNVDGIGFFAFDIINAVTFATLDIDTVGVGGVVLDGAEILDSLTFGQLDINGSVTAEVGLGIVGSTGTVDVNNGTIENTDGELFGLIASDVTLTYTGTATQTFAGRELVLIDGDDDSIVTFEAGVTMTATEGRGIRSFDGDGTYTFDCPVNVTAMSNRGVDIQSGSAGIFNFNGMMTLNTGSSAAVRYDAGGGSQLNFLGGLDIDTTSGTGFQVISSATGSISVTGSDNTVDAESGNPINIRGGTIAAAGMSFRTVNSTAGGRITVSNTGNIGSFNITGTGLTDGSGGTLTGANAQLRILNGGDVRFNIRNLNIENFENQGVNIRGRDDDIIRGTLDNLSVTTAVAGSEGIRITGDDNDGPGNFNVLVRVNNTLVNVPEEGVNIRSRDTTMPALVSVNMSNNDITSTANAAVACLSNDSARLCLNAVNNTLASATFDFDLDQRNASILTISQASVAALQAANDGGTATATTSGTISTNAVCQTP